MVNPSGISGQSKPDKAADPSAEGLSDKKLPENSQENLDSRLDHAIEETFPTSDPVSVTITKGPGPDRPERDARSLSAEDSQGSQPEESIAEHLLDQVRGALHEVADGASDAAQGMYTRGEHYARQAREQYPEAERYVRTGQQAVIQRVTESPLLALFVAGAVGYALAWMIHGQRRTRDIRVPDYGRTDRGHTPYQRR